MRSFCHRNRSMLLSRRRMLFWRIIRSCMHDGLPLSRLGWLPGTTVYHKVRKGETLSGIAQKYGVSVSNLRSWNNLRKNSYLRIGQRLAVCSKTTTSKSGLRLRLRQQKANIIRFVKARTYGRFLKNIKGFRPKILNGRTI